jgi:hypothetical protein
VQLVRDRTVLAEEIEEALAGAEVDPRTLFRRGVDDVKTRGRRQALPTVFFGEHRE